MALPTQQAGYPIIYVDEHRQEGYCAECAADHDDEDLTPHHLLEGCEEPLNCSDCGCEV